MSNFTVARIGDEIYATYGDGVVQIIVKREATDDFVLDCALILDEMPAKIAERIKYIEGKVNR